MRRWLVILLVATVFLPAVALAAGEEAAPGVDKFMMEAKAGGGPVAVIGLVSKANPVEKRFGMSDAKKFGCCDTPANCVTGVLPVEWQGKMPADGSRVRARGKVVEEGGKLLFRADDVKVLEEPKK